MAAAVILKNRSVIFMKFGNPIAVLLARNMPFDKIKDGCLEEVCTL